MSMIRPAIRLVFNPVGIGYAFTVAIYPHPLGALLLVVYGYVAARGSFSLAMVTAKIIEFALEGAM